MRDPDTDTRKGSPLVLVVFVVVSLVLTSVYYREGDDGLLHRGRSIALAVTAPIASAGHVVTSPFRAIGGYFGGLFASGAELESLRIQNDELRQRLADLEEARIENERLRELVDFVETQDLEYLGARVVGRPVTSWEGAIQIDRGAADDVTVGMPVIAPHGIVGQVVEVSEHASKVRTITDRRSGVASLVQASRATGIVRGSIEGELRLDFVDADVSPEEGDVVVTSGLGGVYPKGLMVGDVAEVTIERDLLYPRVVVNSRVPVTTLEEVLVILGPLPTPDLGPGE
jgi:rod shape-determining protein MreC